MEHSENADMEGVSMKIKLTEKGKALLKILRSEKRTKHIEKYIPKMEMYTLVRIDSKGRKVSEEQILIDENRYFKRRSAA